jgi:hypothetical protein
MATRTTYLNLIKPDYSDAADIADINANMDTLDDKIKGIDSAAIHDTLVPTSDSGTIRNQLSQLANRIKAATGAGGWKDNPSTTLASLATLVSNLASGSDVTWNGEKFTNTKLGIIGLMDINGYISFGKNFGGLIIQWGTWMESDSAKSMTVKLPISARIYQVFLTDSSLEGNSEFNFTMCWDRDHVGTNVSSFNVKSTNPPSSFSWFFVGREN